MTIASFWRRHRRPATVLMAMGIAGLTGPTALTAAASAASGHTVPAIAKASLPRRTVGLAGDACTVTSSTPTSLSIKYTLKFKYAECSPPGTITGCVYQLFIQLSASGFNGSTFNPTLNAQCPGGQTETNKPGTYVPYYDYPLPAGTGITCTVAWGWPTGEYASGFAVDATELDGTGITDPNSIHSFGTSLPPPPPVASFTDKAVAGHPDEFQFTDTSTTLSGKPLKEAWSASDESVGTGVTWEHTFVSSGTFTVTLTVTDVVNQSDTTSHDVAVPPPVGSTARITVKEMLSPSADAGRFDLIVGGALVAGSAKTGQQGTAVALPGRYLVRQIAKTINLTYYGVSIACTKNGHRDVSATATAVSVAVAAGNLEVCTFVDTRTAARHCDVPNLLGETQAAATASLTANGCALGTVTKPPTGSGTLVVKSSTPGAYAVLTAGTRVAITLHYV